jgi:uncharacterized membrane protein YuzA (DUF378 family)
MSIRNEIDDRGLVPFVALVLLSLGSANRGLQQFFDVDAVSILPGPWPAWIMTAVGVIGIVTLIELLTDLEVVPSEYRL